MGLLPHPTLHFRTQLIPAGRAHDWTALLEQWFAHYPTESAIDQQVVLRAAEADWQLRLTAQAHDEAQDQDQPEEALRLHERRLERAERAFLRWHRTCEQLRRARLTEQLRLEAHEWRRATHEAQLQERTATARRRAQAAAEEEEEEKPRVSRYDEGPSPFPQHIIVQVDKEGRTRTIYNPGLDDTLRVLDDLATPDSTVQRVLRLPQPLPPEYDWARAPDGTPLTSMVWLTPVAEFRQDVARDRAHGNGHTLHSPTMPNHPDHPDYGTGVTYQ